MKLLQQILDILLRIVKEETSKETGFVVSMSKDDDYNEVSMAKALSVVQTKGLGGAQTESELADLISSVNPAFISVIMIKFTFQLQNQFYYHNWHFPI